MILHEFKGAVQMPLMQLPARSTVLQLKDRVIIISPIDFTPEQILKIRSYGPVTDLVAPNLIHNKYMAKAALQFPQAIVWAPPGMKDKLPYQKWDKTLSQDSWPYQNEIELLLVKGAHSLNEVVFFLKEIKTLIVTDLVFNLQNARGIGAWIILSMFGTYRRFGVSRLINRYIHDKPSLQGSLYEILKWDFDQLVMAHGDIVKTNAHGLLTEALKERNYI